MKKDKTNEIIKNIDRAISELVYEKTSIVKAYNYYHGHRDPEQFRHLEENYGIGTPTSVEFIPLIKKHIDVLVGEFLAIPIDPKVSCKDEETLSNIFRDKSIHINNIIKNELSKLLKKVVKGQQDINNDAIEKQLQKLQELAERNFISDYEIAGQNIVDYIITSQKIDFINKLKTILIDLLVSGTAYYKASPTASGTNMDFRVLNPIHTFIDRNVESPYLNKSYRGVVRSYNTKHQILQKHGKYLTPDDLEELDTLDSYPDENTDIFVRVQDEESVMRDGILGGFEVAPIFPYDKETGRYYKVFPVYEVEWLQTDLEDGIYVTNRYEGIRINTNIYIPIGKVDIPRSMDDPTEATLSINGMFYTDRNGDPFSLMISTMNLQDKYDVLNFYRDNVIAESGSVGDWLDVAHLPTFLGKDTAERLLKWKAYKKSGLALYDSSQEGEVINTSFAGYDDTIKLQTIQAIDLAIQRTEETASSTTGVFREKLGGIEQRDAVSNVAVGVRQSTYITKQYYQTMDLLTKHILVDLLNIAKKTYKNGITGSIILGDRLSRIFTALPEHYTFTDFDIHIVDSSEVIKEQEIIKQLTIELSKGGAVDPEIIIEVATSSGLTKMKEEVKKSIAKKAEENNQLQQYEQKVQELDKQLKEATQATKQLEGEVKRLNEAKLQLEKEKLSFEEEIGWYTAKSEDDFRESKLELDKKRVELEAVQLVDDNKQNDEIKNN